MKKAKAQRTNFKGFVKLIKEDPNIKQATIMLSASVVVLIIAIISLNSLGFFHMIAGVAIPRGMVKPGVIFENNQITQIPEGEIRYRLNTEIMFDNLYSRGSIMLENPAVSQYDLEFKFYLPKDQQNPVYSSPRLKPGECLLSDKLTDRLSLKRGEYTCLCVVEAYDKNGEYIGNNNCSVKLYILDN